MADVVLDDPIKARFALMCGAAFLAAGPAWAQQAEISPEQLAAMEQTATFATMIVNLVIMVVFGAILLIARRDMKGWDQPVTFVWFAFQGRLNRKAYWLKGGVLVALIVFAAQLAAGATGWLVGLVAGPAIGGGLAFIVLLPVIVFQFWVSIAMAVKRAHDLNHSGWWVLGTLIPIWNIWVMIQILFFRGTVGANGFGADPIDPYDDYIDELAGGMDGGGDDDTSARPHPHSHPHPPQDDGPLGFGGRKFAPKPAPSAPTPAAQPVQVQENVDMDLIRRRLGDDFLKRDN